MSGGRQRDVLSWCLGGGSLEQTAVGGKKKSGFTCSFVFFDVLLVFSAFGGERTWVNGGTVNFTNPAIPPLFSPSVSRALSLSRLGQTTVSIAVCLPSSKNRLVGNLMHTQSHTLSSPGQTRCKRSRSRFAAGSSAVETFISSKTSRRSSKSLFL